MRKIIIDLISMTILFVYSCDKDDKNNDNNNINFEQGTGWFTAFNGTIDGGEGFDVVKSKIDDKVYVCGAFLHVNDDWDMKNLARWSPSSNTWEVVPGIDFYQGNFIRCSVADKDGNLYFGGDFSKIGDIVAGKVGKFNVSSGTWENLRDINFFDEEDQRGPKSGGVYDIEIVGNYLYIGGGIFNSDSAELKYIRRFNISEKKWEAVGTGVNGRVKSFAVDNSGNLYVGGEFTEAGGVAVNHIAKWDGQNWSALGNGCDNYVLSVEYDNGNLYAGGSFKYVGDNIRSQGIAKWTGTSWEAMSKGVYASWSDNYTVQDIAIDSDGKVFIGGFFDKKYSDDKPLNHVGVFENGEWQQLNEGIAISSSQGVIGMMADGKDIYFVGYFGKPGEGVNDRFNIAVWRQ